MGSSTTSTESAGITSAEGRILAVQLEAIRSEQRRIADTLQEVSRTLAVLTRVELEQQAIMRLQSNHTDRISAQDQRLQVVERDMPPLLEMRKWVITGVLAGVGMIGAAVVKLVVVDRPPVVPTYTAPAQPSTKP